jgi:Tol biopolymer transport system component
MKKLTITLFSSLMILVMLVQFTGVDATIQNSQFENAINNQVRFDEPGTTTRVSVASDGTQANDISGAVRISTDGRYVAFGSWASNLVSGDTNGVRDIFVHDRQTKETTLVSVASDGTQGNAESKMPSISADGRYVAFVSDASNLVPGDTNGWSDVFVHDRQTGQTTMVSVATDGSLGDGPALFPQISSDGRFVAFVSDASNLVPGDTNGWSDVFVHDQQTGETTRVSVASDGTQANYDSFQPTISANGRYVGFHSWASNLVYGDTNGYDDVFIHDRETGETTRVSVASDGTQGNGKSKFPSISSDGRFVAFVSDASNLVQGDTNDSADVFVHDRQTGETTRVSVRSDGMEVNNAYVSISHIIREYISADGRYVTFTSNADNLVPGDTNGVSDVFVHDRQSGKTIRISVASDGEQGTGSSGGPSISLDGRYVGFWSIASNLVNNDTNGVQDIFVHHVALGSLVNISGRVIDQGNFGIQDVKIRTNTGNYTTTDIHGFYSFSLLEGTYTLSASKSGLIFFPNTLTVNLQSNKTGQDFIGEIAYCGTGTDGTRSIICQAPLGEPFLHIPFSTAQFAETILQNWYPSSSGGRINSWFDHNKPIYSRDLNRKILLFDGTEYGGSAYKYINGIYGCYQNICYDGHDAIDFLFRQEESISNGRHIVPAASGTMLEVCRRDGNSCSQDVLLGRYVIISHLNNTYATLYAHLRSIESWVVEGYEITRGDDWAPVIGIMGGSGGEPLRENFYGEHLHFQVFFNKEMKESWIPNGNEVVDPFGWGPFWQTDPWGKTVPSVWLWRNYQPFNIIPGEWLEFMSLGRVTVEIPAKSEYQNQLVLLSPSTHQNISTSFIRSIGNAFSLFVSNTLRTGNSLNSTLREQFSDYTTPVKVSIDYADINPHLDSTQLSVYQYDDFLKQWIKIHTNLDPVNFIATAQVIPYGNFDVQAPLVCPNDITEPHDDHPSYLNVIRGNHSEITLERWFDIEQDQDWFSIYGFSGYSYSITTMNLNDGVDTELSVYHPDGETLLAFDDNSGEGLASHILFSAPEDGIYHIKVSRAETSAFGCDSSYDIHISPIHQPPIAIAGPDQTVEPGVLVTLDGSGSYDPDEDLPIKYNWTQVSGTSIVLTGANTANPTFLAPDNPDVLVFLLFIEDSLGLVSDPDRVVISVTGSYDHKNYLPLILR